MYEGQILRRLPRVRLLSIGWLPSMATLREVLWADYLSGII